MVGTGFIIGVVSGCLCFMCVLTIGVTKQIFNRIRSRVANPFLKEVLPPLIGGLVIGTSCCHAIKIVFSLLCYIFYFNYTRVLTFFFLPDIFQFIIIVHSFFFLTACVFRNGELGVTRHCG